MDKIWRLLTAMFMLLTALVLFVMSFVSQGVAAIMGVCYYAAIFCALIGIAKGLLVIIDYNKEHKDEE